MNFRLLLPIAASLLLSCGAPKNSDHDSPSGTDTTDVNQALYYQVMSIHDEVMPKMNDIEALKKKLKDEIATSPNMVPEARKQLERRIANLDSVGNMMMDWMHKFSMPADSLGEEAVREYLESQMEKVKKVREAFQEIITAEGGKQ